MKKLLFIATVLLAVTLSANEKTLGQQNKHPKYLLEKTYKGNPDGFSVLKDGDRVAFIIDYSSGIIRGLSEQDNSDLMGKKEWEDAKQADKKEKKAAKNERQKEKEEKKVAKEKKWRENVEKYNRN